MPSSIIPDDMVPKFVEIQQGMQPLIPALRGLPSEIKWEVILQCEVVEHGQIMILIARFEHHNLKPSAQGDIILEGNYKSPYTICRKCGIEVQLH